MNESSKSEHCGPAAPGPEHAELLRNVGAWDVACQYFHAGAVGMEVAAKEVVAALGGFWTVSDFEANLNGFPLRGKATVGYNPISKRYHSTWVDSSNPWLFSFEGARDPKTGALEMAGENHDPGTGIMTKFRTREVSTGPDNREFTMWYTAPGCPEAMLALYRYTRRK